MTKSIYLKLIISLPLVFILFIFPQEGLSQHSPGMVKEFTDHSVLSSGNWYKISVASTGVFKLSYDELLAMGFDLQGTDPRYIQLYGNGNGMVPESNAQARYDDLMENAVVVVGEEDGIFDPQDYILFYGLGPEIWKYNYFTGLFEHQVNYYTDATFYFLTIGQSPGQRIPADSLITQDPEYFIQEFTDYAVHEEESINILKSGKLWWGEHYKSQLNYEYAFQFPNVINQEKVSLRTNVAARSTENSNFDYFYEGLHLVTAEVSKINLNSTIYAWSITPDTASFYPSNDNVSIKVTYSPTSIVAEGWMNYIELNARRQLKMAGPQLGFREHRIYGTGKVARFRIQDAPAGLTVWDVTDRFSITRVNGTYEDGDYVFKTHLDVLREFIAFDGTSFHSASFVEEVENQNLHAMAPAEYIIVTAPEFYDQAVRLGQLHQQVDGLSFLVVTPQQIYNEFSSGAQDISAIRDFCRMLYQRAEQGNQPGYLLLFGDGSYDPKCRAVPDCNHIPTFQSLESLKYGYSFVTEDFFALYDNDEGNNAYGKTVDLGVGRFPVNTYEEAKQMVDKIQHYLNGQALVSGNWRNRICYIADDEDNNTHFKQAEKLQAIVDTSYVSYNIDKIYIDAYRQISTPSGNRYPEVNEAITNAVEKGALIINYTGHGGENGWAHESILDIPTINSWDNFDHMPLFITATCEFSRFDEPGIVSAGEWVILNPKGGGVSLFTTTRLAWSDPNFKLNRIIYQHAFEKTNGEYPRLGDLVRISKTIMNTSQNVKNFVLLGDPALRLAYPEMEVISTSVEAGNQQFSYDTLMAMSQVSIEGMIVDEFGNHLPDFHGYVTSQVFDKKAKYYTLGNDAGSPIASFELRDRLLFQGRFTVQNGKFSFSFIMPKDIAYEFGEGKISYYAVDTVTYRDASGYTPVVIGGITPFLVDDFNGPSMELFMDDLGFKSGDLVSNAPILMVYLNDESGINHTGNGIGHDITGILNGDTRQPLTLNEHFIPDLDNPYSGWVYYTMDALPDGTHTIEVKAWDIMNNASEISATFVVNQNGNLIAGGAYNQPNPFKDQTQFGFLHNRSDGRFTVEIEVYNLQGQKVFTLNRFVSSNGQDIEPITWDGTDQSGNPLTSGMYVYRMKILDETGHYSEQSNKLIIGR